MSHTLRKKTFSHSELGVASEHNDLIPFTRSEPSLVPRPPGSEAKVSPCQVLCRAVGGSHSATLGGFAGVCGTCGFLCEGTISVLAEAGGRDVEGVCDTLLSEGRRELF